ncbi:MAG: penicillin acylase family protein [Myxococcales bacterium]|nr:penicillin acylase family protein [Myxococcales bacterium]
MHLSWEQASEPCQLELEVKEPCGSICSIRQTQTPGGGTLLANDPHLDFASPSIFWASHLSVVASDAAASDGDLDVAGITFPGIPGIILGHNGHVAWGATTVNHDVTDYYLEDVVPCTSGGGDCVVFDGGQVPIETWDETIKVGALGTITSEYTVTYENVPHHGPIIPTIVDGELAPRPAGPAVSVRYTGHEPTYEFAAFLGLWRATDVTEAKAAFDRFGFGAQNWVLADDAGHIGWTSQAHVPWRSAGCFSFDPEDPTAGGVAPWWIVPGDGSCEWEGYMDAAYLPQEVDPDRGFIATANGDPVGATADGNPLDEPVVDGHLLYVGARDYDVGYRVGRITRRLEAEAPGTLDADTMTSIQADAHSNLGEVLTPHLRAAIAAYQEELASAGTHPELTAFVAGLGQGARDRIAAADALLAAWTFDTPSGIGAADASTEGRDSAATVVFNAWAVKFVALAFGDEAAALGRGPGTWLAPVAVAALDHPADLVTGVAPETGEALLCDDYGTPGTIESCTLMALRALDSALTWASGAGGLADADPAAWRWGEVHRLTLGALLPSDDLSVPPPGEPDPALRGGYPRHGDNFSVDASSPGLGDLDFTYNHGPAMRHVTTLVAGSAPRTLLAIPGGEQMDTRSPHWRDLMDDYWSVNGYFELPWTIDQVHAAHESRLRLE